MKCKTYICHFVRYKIVSVRRACTLKTNVLDEMIKSANCAMTVSIIIYEVSVFAVFPGPFNRIVAAASAKLLCLWTGDFENSLNL
jgi:hypothetical protein